MPRSRELLPAVVVSVAIFTLYTGTLVPGVLDGDHGEFQYVPRVLGLPHPTGYPLYLLLGWLWSWLPVGTLAFRMNLFSALWGAVTVTLLFIIARRQGLSPPAALGGALALGLAGTFWLFSAIAAVYTLHTALLAGAILLWLRWSQRLSAGKPSGGAMGVAALCTGLTLTNHPTAAFVVPAVLLFVLSHLGPLRGSARVNRRSLRDLAAAGLLFALPGVLYAYVPVRLSALEQGAQVAGLRESISRGVVTPFLQWGQASVPHYITGRSFVASYSARWELLLSDLPGQLTEQFGFVLVFTGAAGAAISLWRHPRAFLLLGALFLPSGLYAVSYAAQIAGLDQVTHVEGHLLPAMLATALWSAYGIDGGIRLLSALTRRPGAAQAMGAVAVGAIMWMAHAGEALPTAASREQSQAIHNYWTEVLAYPLEREAALTGHWGDLTAFWYFQHGESLRPDLWAIFPPDGEQIDRWLAESGRPVYVAGPLLDWSAESLARYNLTPMGILVRVAPHDMPVVLPPLEPRSSLFGEQLQLNGFSTMEPASGRLQIWMAWQTVAPTHRDLSVSVRLHGPDDALLLQEDGRLASLWYPEGTMPEGTQLLTVFDLDLPPAIPPGTVVRIVVYDPYTGQPLVTPEWQDVFELGLLR
jgi:hypothetical protein